MRFGVTVPTYGPYARPDTFAMLVRRAEELGFDDVWFGDHVVIPDYAVELSTPDWFEAITCCAVASGLTTRLRVGTDVLVLPGRDPLLLAKQVSTLDQLSGGRATLAVGIGYLRGELEALGRAPYEQRAAVTEEWLAMLRHVWTNPGPLSFDGRHVAFRDLHVSPRPVQVGGVPRWVGGNHANAIRRAALLGDGWHPLWPTPAEYAAARQEILALRQAQRLTSPFTFSYSCPETRVVHDGAVHRPFSHGDMEAPEEFSYVPPVPTAPGGRPLLTGTVDELRDDVATLADAGVEHLTLRFWAGSPDVTPAVFVSAMETFAEQVAGAP